MPRQPNHLNEPERPEGFYWVKFNGELVPALYTAFSSEDVDEAYLAEHEELTLDEELNVVDFGWQLDFAADEPRIYFDNELQWIGPRSPHAVDQEWSQPELKSWLLSQGFNEASLRPGEIIPQGVKYVSAAPLTETDIERAKQLIASGQIPGRITAVSTNPPSTSAALPDQQGETAEGRTKS